MFLHDSDPRVGRGTPFCSGRLHCEGRGREGVGVISMTTDRRGFLVAKVVEQGQGVSDCSHPDRKSKRTTTMREGGRGAIFRSQITSGMEGQNITIITAPGMSGTKEQGGDGGPGGGLGKKNKSRSANMSEFSPFLEPRTKNLAPYYGSL